MKRFTETEKWKDPWFRKLSPKLKCLWSYLCDTCCPAGTFDLDWELASFVVGETVVEDDLKFFQGRIVKLPNSRRLIIKFISFQYGTLSEDCRAHGTVFKAISQNLIPYPYPIDRVGDTLKDKDQDQDQDKEKPIPIKKCFLKPEMPELSLQGQKIGLPTTEIDKFFNYYESNGWRVGKNPMKSWKSAMQNWKINYEQRTHDQAYRQNPRNSHIITGPTDYASAARRKLQREQGEEKAGVVQQVAENGIDPSKCPCSPERSAQLLREVRQAAQ